MMEMNTNPKYVEILRLNKMLTQFEIPHRLVKCFDGWQVIYPDVTIDKSIADAIEHCISYGSKYDMLDRMGLLTDEEQQIALAKGNMTAEEVFQRIKSHWEENKKMREILFRGKRVSDGEWVYGYVVKAKQHFHKRGIHEDYIITSARSNGGYFVVNSRYAVDPETLGQGVGITDKNGEEIFEGDILNIEGLGNAVVRFGKYNDCHSDFNDDYAVGFYLEKGNIKCNILKDVEMMSGCEIIGNIYDNPELLEVQ